MSTTKFYQDLLDDIRCICMRKNEEIIELRAQLTESEAKYKREMDAACEHVRGVCEERTKLRTQLVAVKECSDIVIRELREDLHRSNAEYYREKLEGESAALKVTQKLLSDARNQLANEKAYSLLCGKKNQTLLEQLADLQERHETLMEQFMELTKPKLVKQTWQRICEDQDGETTYEFDEIPDTISDQIATLRRDHYTKPDGTTFVECELEPIEGEKK